MIGLLFRTAEGFTYRIAGWQSVGAKVLLVECVGSAYREPHEERSRYARSGVAADVLHRWLATGWAQQVTEA